MGERGLSGGRETVREEQEVVVVDAAAALLLVAIFWSAGLLG
jgi:hypothetical protein